MSILLFHVWGEAAPRQQSVSLGDVGDFVFSNLDLGVPLFFVLSGFLLYRPYAAALLVAGPLPSSRRYFRHRALRILPAYWVAVLAVALVSNRTLSLDQPTGPFLDAFAHPGQLLAHMLLVQNYLPDLLFSGVSSSWSLAIEVVFYALLPIVSFAAARLVIRRHQGRRAHLAILAPPLALLAVGVIGKLLVSAYVPTPPGAEDPGFEADWHSVLSHSFLCYADLFSVGMSLAVVRVLRPDGLRLTRRRRWTVIAAGALLLFAGVFFFDLSEPGLSAGETVATIGVGLMVTPVLLARELGKPTPGLRLLESGPVRAVGLASYSLFLWHEPIILWLSTHHLTLPGASGMLINLLVVSVISGVAAALSYRYVERPALRRKDPSRRTSSAVAAGDPAATLAD